MRRNEEQTMGRRVVITGMGLISPLGLDLQTSWDALLAGKSGVGPITRFDATDFPCKIAAEVTGFNAEDHFSRKELRKIDLFSQYGMVCAAEALEDSGFQIHDGNADRVGVYIGSGIGGLPVMETVHATLLERGPKRVSPFFIPAMILNLAAGNVSIQTGAKGPNMALATACATGTHAIGESYRMISEGYADAMISGGTESGVSALAMAGFSSMKALSTRNDEPERASRPFAADRDGFVLGEGAGILILEEREAAIARSARIYAEVTGYGMSGDAFHISAPAADGGGAVRSMSTALKRSGIRPDEVDYINAHGTSTPAGDEIEVRAVKQVFGDHAYKLVCGSTKSMTGHLLGAAGGLEAIVAAKAVADDVIPPTINQENPDPECDLDTAPEVKRETTVRTALSNSFGFGGTNATLILSKHKS
jgi:3-oxoacyl-[acyl-carrier-protein] synthase II